MKKEYIGPNLEIEIIEIKDICNASILFGSVILTGKTDGGVKERRTCDINHAFETLGGSVSGDGFPAEGVDGGLNGNIRYGVTRALNGGGETYFEHFAEGGSVDFHFAPDETDGVAGVAEDAVNKIS